MSSPRIARRRPSPSAAGSRYATPPPGSVTRVASAPTGPNGATGQATRSLADAQVVEAVGVDEQRSRRTHALRRRHGRGELEGTGERRGRRPVAEAFGQRRRCRGIAPSQPGISNSDGSGSPGRDRGGSHVQDRRGRLPRPAARTGAPSRGAASPSAGKTVMRTGSHDSASSSSSTRSPPKNGRHVPPSRRNGNIGAARSNVASTCTTSRSPSLLRAEHADAPRRAERARAARRGRREAAPRGEYGEVVSTVTRVVRTRVGGQSARASGGPGDGRSPACPQRR